MRSAAPENMHKPPLANAMLANLDQGPPTKDLAGALNNLAQLHGAVGRDAEAEPRFKRALAIMERVLGLESVDIASELNLAARCQREQRYAEAEPLLKRALALSERSLPANHPAIGRALDNLATNYETLGRHAESEALTWRGLAIREAAVGPDHPDTAASVSNLASLYQAEGRAAVPLVAPMISLALSIPKQPSALDHGLLTASEVAQQELNARWVVLSVCNTIAGDKPGAEALRRVMLADLNEASSPKNADPAFWGPFALIGAGAAR